MATICWARSTGCFIYNFVIQVISEKQCLAKILLAIWDIFLNENNRNYNSYRFSYKFAFILFFSFLTNQKQESGFQQVGGLVTTNISVFCLQRVALYFKAMPNSIGFYKGIFLHVISVRIIVLKYGVHALILDAHGFIIHAFLRLRFVLSFLINNNKF